MLGAWAAFASALTEDDPLLPPSPEFHDDDPSSYLLYPPGFGPAADWPADGRHLPMLAPEAADPGGSCRKAPDLAVDWGREEAAADGSGAVELMGLSEALSGKVSLVGGCEDSGCGGKDGVVEYIVIGSLENNTNGDGDEASGARGNGKDDGSGVSMEVVGLKEDGNGVRGAPHVVKTEVKVEYDDEETNQGNGGSSESGSDGSSSSSSSSSSSTSEESSEEDEEDDNKNDGDDEDDRDGGERGRLYGSGDFEEGEIRDLDAEQLAMSSDEDEDGGVKGPIRSKHELEALPPVPAVNATLEPHHQTLPVGMVSSVIGTKVIVEGLEKHSPLNEGSIMWVTETRSPLGLVDEIFGPVKNPYYVVRFNSEKEIPAGVCEGTAVSFVMDFANHILNDPTLYRKGYDASGDNDEEVGDDVEFSDDEKEAEYKRSLRQAKRGTDNRRQRDQESVGKKRVQFDKRRFQTKSTGFGKRRDMQSNALAPISQPRNVASKLPSTLRQPFGPSALPPIRQQPNVPNLIQSRPQQRFNPGQVQALSRPPCVPSHVQAPSQPPHVPGQVQAPAQPPCIPGQVQVPSQTPYAPAQVQARPQPPCVLGQSQPPPQQQCVPDQLQSLKASVRHPSAPGQLQASTSLHYVPGPLPGPTLSPRVPGLQAPSLAGNVGVNDLTSFVAGHSCFSGPPTVPAIPYRGQLGGPFALAQQNLLMPRSNALWASQQFITSLSSIFQNNGMLYQQQQAGHTFHQNQNQLFPGFNNGMPLQQHFIPNQGIPPNTMPWQGGLPNPSVGPRPSEPMGQDGLGQVPLGHIGTGERGPFGLPNQSHGQSETASPQGDMHAPMNFSLGNSSIRGQKPYGRGGRRRS